MSPSSVSVKADRDVLTLTISKTVMSDVMKDLKYRVQYWERLKPEQVTHTHIIFFNPNI